jgi:hypothetical protein
MYLKMLIRISKIHKIALLIIVVFSLFVLLNCQSDKDEEELIVEGKIKL